jgi:hypothetical protein
MAGYEPGVRQNSGIRIGQANVSGLPFIMFFSLVCHLMGLPFSSRGKRSVRPGLTATAGYADSIFQFS